MTRQPLFESEKTKDLLSLNKRCSIQPHFINGYTPELNSVLYGLVEANPAMRLSAE